MPVPLRMLLSIAVALLLLPLAACDDTAELQELAEELSYAISAFSAGGLPFKSTLPAETEQEVIEDDGYTGAHVYVTPHGTKYHDPECRHARNSENLRRMSREEAVAGRYEPCKVCNPGLPQ